MPFNNFLLTKLVSPMSSQVSSSVPMLALFSDVHVKLNKCCTEPVLTSLEGLPVSKVLHVLALVGSTTGWNLRKRIYWGNFIFCAWIWAWDSPSGVLTFEISPRSRLRATMLYVLDAPFSILVLTFFSSLELKLTLSHNCPAAYSHLPDSRLFLSDDFRWLLPLRS